MQRGVLDVGDMVVSRTERDVEGERYVGEATQNLTNGSLPNPCQLRLGRTQQRYSTSLAMIPSSHYGKLMNHLLFAIHEGLYSRCPLLRSSTITGYLCLGCLLRTSLSHMCLCHARTAFSYCSPHDLGPFVVPDLSLSLMANTVRCLIYVQFIGPHRP